MLNMTNVLIDAWRILKISTVVYPPSKQGEVMLRARINVISATKKGREYCEYQIGAKGSALAVRSGISEARQELVKERRDMKRDNICSAECSLQKGRLKRSKDFALPSYNGGIKE